MRAECRPAWEPAGHVDVLQSLPSGRQIQQARPVTSLRAMKGRFVPAQPGFSEERDGPGRQGPGFALPARRRGQKSHGNRAASDAHGLAPGASLPETYAERPGEPVGYGGNGFTQAAGRPGRREQPMTLTAPQHQDPRRRNQKPRPSRKRMRASGPA